MLFRLEMVKSIFSSLLIAFDINRNYSNMIRSVRPSFTLSSFFFFFEHNIKLIGNDLVFRVRESERKRERKSERLFILPMINRSIKSAWLFRSWYSWSCRYGFRCSRRCRSIDLFCCWSTLNEYLSIERTNNQLANQLLVFCICRTFFSPSTRVNFCLHLPRLHAWSNRCHSARTRITNLKAIFGRKSRQRGFSFYCTRRRQTNKSERKKNMQECFD